MKTAELAPGFDQILVPGEPEHDKWEKYTAQGIPMLSAVIDDVKALAEKLGVEVPPLS
jgi:LDH2 family malate/lactate/ureidoglycolate dehydrogenase